MDLGFVVHPCRTVIDHRSIFPGINPVLVARCRFPLPGTVFNGGRRGGTGPRRSQAGWKSISEDASATERGNTTVKRRGTSFVVVNGWVLFKGVLQDVLHGIGRSRPIVDLGR